MAFSNTHKANLGLVTAMMTRDVTNRSSIHLRHYNHLGKTSKAVFDPSLVEQITFCSVKVSIEIETSVSMSRPSYCTQRSQVFLPSQSHRDARWHEGDQLAEHSLERHTHVSQQEVICFGEAHSLRIVGIRKQIKALDAVRGTPSQ